ncbi:MAG: T9SS type A sorting domain-containing protein [Bacteroidetes bacterium]|nr:T9SS type A sorting domain-containing protein [Bacteroidota bacterium]
MTTRVTTFSHFMLALLLLVMALPMTASAQDQLDLGEEFIVFVEGKNVLVPFFDGTAVADPTDASNTVASFAYGGWAAPGFRWDGTVGVDMSSMIGETVAEGGATLYLKLFVDPVMANQTGCQETTFDCLALTLFDRTNGNEITDNREGRLKWFIPEEYRDGQWHDLAIPLPPSTAAAQDSAQAGKNVDGTPLATPLDPLAMHWEYVGGWSGYGWGGTAGTPQGAADPNWQEFEWDGVRGLTVHFDWNAPASYPAGGPVMMDDVYFGSASTDLSSAVQAPSAMSGVTFTTDGASNLISWTHNAEYGGYNVYVDEDPITKARIDAGEVAVLGTVAFNAAAFEIKHDFQIPHSSLLPLPVNYAVASTNLFGVANTDVSASSGRVENVEMEEQAYVIEIDDTGSDEIFNNVGAGNVSDEGFPAKTIPFMVDPSHWSASEGTLPTDPADLSGMFKVGFNRTNNELYVYGEVKDDVLAFHPGTGENPGGDAWGYDSVELGWGAYDVRDANGSVLAGAPHGAFLRGSTPDYQMRISWLGDESSPDPTSTSTYITTGSADTGQGEATGGGTVMDILTDDTGAPIGYKFLTVFTFADFVFATSGDDIFAPPSADAIAVVPFNIAINDGDDPAIENPRTTQVQWTTKPSANNAWWNTPSQWLAVAVVGSQVVGVANEDEALPAEYALQQNYPNPFNPSTSIEFSLPAAGNVNLTVYNVLGQKVATLVNNQTMSTGKHSIQFDASQLASGTYIYRLQAGDQYVSTKMMMLIK